MLKDNRIVVSSVCMCSVVQWYSTLCNPMDVACQVPLSMGFPRHEYWSGLPFPPPGDRLDPWIKPVSPKSPALQVDFLTLSHHGKFLNRSLNNTSSFFS